MPDVKYEILATLLVFPQEGNYHKELNLIKWGNNPPKYDLRGWTGDHSGMTKGITLSKDDVEFLQIELPKVNLKEEK